MNETPRLVTETPADMFTVAESAKYLGKSTKTIWRSINDGRLRAVRVGSKSIRVRRADLDAQVKHIEPKLVYLAP